MLWPTGCQKHYVSFGADSYRMRHRESRQNGRQQGQVYKELPEVSPISCAQWQPLHEKGRPLCVWNCMQIFTNPSRRKKNLLLLQSQHSTACQSEWIQLKRLRLWSWGTEIRPTDHDTGHYIKLNVALIQVSITDGDTQGLTSDQSSRVSRRIWDLSLSSPLQEGKKTSKKEKLHFNNRSSPGREASQSPNAPFQESKFIFRATTGPRPPAPRRQEPRETNLTHSLAATKGMHVCLCHRWEMLSAWEQ